MTVSPWNRENFDFAAFNRPQKKGNLAASGDNLNG
jgi:hypothetical protein